MPPTPIYNIQQGANGELWAEPDPSMSFHPSQDPNGGYTVDYTVDYSIPQEEEEQVCCDVRGDLAVINTFVSGG